MSANAGLITVETYVQGKTIENQLFIYVAKMWILSTIFGSLPLTHIYVHVKLFIFGEALTSNFQGNMSASQSRNMYNKGKK